MKITPQTHTVNPTDELLLCVDVSKSTLNLFSQYTRHGCTFRIEDEIPNATDTIEHVLARCQGIADEAGLSAVRVLAEPTGGYQRKLLQTARRLGHRTARISPEHVAQLKKVESNDTGKTDHKDPRVMHLVARLGKAQRHRHLPETYRKLRRLTSYYDDEEGARSAVRQRIHALIEERFPDYDKNAAFTFGATGTALMQLYLQPVPYRPRRLYALRKGDQASLEVHALRYARPPLRAGRTVGPLRAYRCGARPARRSIEGALVRL